ncbi:MAG: ATP-binding cassette domain-containing protein [Bacteroidales bacterium]|nr:ATP-binding cassette domain-containing protein [Bacteroidales bacterium]
MSVILQAEHLHKSFGPLVLFNDINLHIREGEKCALIAPNGSGKSSLLRVLSGTEPPETGGKVFVHPGVSVGYLPQEPWFDPEHTLFEAVFSSANKSALTIRRYEEALAEGHPDKLSEAVAAMDREQVWDYEQRIQQILTILGIAHLDRRVGNLSGGQRKRLALAALLLREPKLFILDEPTNHLDTDMIEWLEDFLEKSRCTLLMVTHDRYFLDRICNRIYELDRGVLYSYNGNYTCYLEKRQERIDRQQAQTDRARNLLRNELEWMRRTPQARSGKAKYRINAFYDLAEKAGQSYRESSLRMNVQTARMGKKIIECTNLCHSYDSLPTLSHFSYTFSPMEKIGIVGPNGVGKTTLLKLLTGELSPVSGNIERGETVRFGYYSQDGLAFESGQKLIDVVRQIAEVVTLSDGKQLSVTDFLQYFLFPPDRHYVYVDQLSGGEKRRLYLLTVLMQQPNFLILDEPTNDLDIITLNVLEEYLQSFKGCVLLVSHDRYFLDKIADHLFIFEGEGKVKDFVGDYSAYHACRKQSEEQAARFDRQKQKQEQLRQETFRPPKPETKQKRSFKEQREFEQLEIELEALEQEKQSIETRLSSGTLTLDALQSESLRFKEILSLIDSKTDRWFALSDF